MDGGAWWATVHGVAKSRTRLSNFPSFHFFIEKRSQWTIIPLGEKIQERTYQINVYCLRSRDTDLF